MCFCFVSTVFFYGMCCSFLCTMESFLSFHLFVLAYEKSTLEGGWKNSSRTHTSLWKREMVVVLPKKSSRLWFYGSRHLESFVTAAQFAIFAWELFVWIRELQESLQVFCLLPIIIYQKMLKVSWMMICGLCPACGPPDKPDDLDHHWQRRPEPDMGQRGHQQTACSAPSIVELGSIPHLTEGWLMLSL